MSNYFISTTVLVVQILAYVSSLGIEPAFPILSIIVRLISLLFIPGLLIYSLISNRQEIEAVDLIINSVALSVTYVMGAGLLASWLLKPIGFNADIVQVYIGTGNLLLTIIRYVAPGGLKIKGKNFRPIEYLFIVSLAILPISVIFGTVRLNNGAANGLVYLSYLLIPVFILVQLRIFRFGKTIYSVIYIISLSMLLSLSLRSFHISGYDISREFQVFQINKNSGFWSYENFKNAYNACLSITVLPILIVRYSGISDVLVYKLVFPFIFGLVPVIIFKGIRHIYGKFIAFISTLFFITVPWFIDPMTQLSRQQIAFLYYSLIIFLLVSGYKAKHNRVLVYLYGASLVVSHYSTTYIVMFLLIFMYGAKTMIRLVGGIRKRLWNINADYIIFQNLTFAFLLFFISLVFFWYMYITSVGNNFTDVADSTIRNLNKIFNDEGRATIINQVLKLDKSGRPEEIISNYEQKIIEDYSKNTIINLYGSSLRDNFKYTPVNAKIIPIKNELIYRITLRIFNLLLYFLQISVVISSFAILFKLKQKNSGQVELFIVNLFFLVLISASIIVPYISIAYNFDRIFMQGVMTLGAFIFMGYFLVREMQHVKVFGSLVLYLLLIFIFNYGLVWQILGGKAVMWFNNYGHNFDLTYTFKGEVEAAYWLGSNSSNSIVYADTAGKNRLWGYANINTIRNDIFPRTIDVNSYVYLTHRNHAENTTYLFYEGIAYGYPFPKTFVENNKNKIYSNQDSIIYR